MMMMMMMNASFFYTRIHLSHICTYTDQSRIRNKHCYRIGIVEKQYWSPPNISSSNCFFFFVVFINIFSRWSFLQKNPLQMNGRNSLLLLLLHYPATSKHKEKAKKICITNMNKFISIERRNICIDRYFCSFNYEMEKAKTQKKKCVCLCPNRWENLRRDLWNRHLLHTVHHFCIFDIWNVCTREFICATANWREKRRAKSGDRRKQVDSKKKQYEVQLQISK